MESFEERLKKLEYYQQLMIQMLPEDGYAFYKLVIKYRLSQDEVEQFYDLCRMLEKKAEQQKAEGFVYFAPLFQDFTYHLTKKLPVREVIYACLQQNIFPALMLKLKNNLH